MEPKDYKQLFTAIFQLTHSWFKREILIDEKDEEDSEETNRPGSDNRNRAHEAEERERKAMCHKTEQEPRLKAEIMYVPVIILGRDIEEEDIDDVDARDIFGTSQGNQMFKVWRPMRLPGKESKEEDGSLNGSEVTDMRGENTGYSDMSDSNLRQDLPIFQNEANTIRKSREDALAFPKSSPPTQTSDMHRSSRIRIRDEAKKPSGRIRRRKW